MRATRPAAACATVRRVQLRGTRYTTESASWGMRLDEVQRGRERRGAAQRARRPRAGVRRGRARRPRERRERRLRQRGRHGLLRERRHVRIRMLGGGDDERGGGGGRHAEEVREARHGRAGEAEPEPEPDGVVLPLAREQVLLEEVPERGRVALGGRAGVRLGRGTEGRERRERRGRRAPREGGGARELERGGGPGRAGPPPAPAPRPAILAAIGAATIGLVVHPRGDKDDGRAKHEREGHGEVEERDGRKERDDDAEAGREALEDVVRVLDHQRGEQPAEHLHRDRRPRPHPKVLEQLEPEPARRRGRLPREDDGEQRGEQREQGQLDVAHPEVCLRVLEDHLKVDAGKARREAGGDDRHEALEGLHVVRQGRV